MGERARSRTLPQWWENILASGSSSSTNAGKLAALAWLRSRSLSAPALTPWHVEISLDVRDAPATLDFDDRTETRFRIEIYSEEWGVFFCHQGKASWIRITDIPFVHGRDDFGLLPIVPALKDVGVLLRSLEKKYAITFRRDHALVRTNVPSAALAIRLWVRSL